MTNRLNVLPEFGVGVRRVGLVAVTLAAVLLSVPGRISAADETAPPPAAAPEAAVPPAAAAPEAAVPAAAEEATMPAADLVGTWSGKVNGPPPPQTLTITVTSVTLGAPAGVLHFAGARGCKLDLEYAGDDSGHHYFIVKRPTGGYCKQLDFGSLDLSPVPTPKVLAFVISKRDNTPTDKGTVAKTE